MKKLFTIMAIVTLFAVASACSMPLVRPVPDEVRPSKESFRNAKRFQEKKVPGAGSYQRAVIAFTKYRRVCDQEKERNDPLLRSQYLGIPDDYFTKRKREHLAEAQKHLKKAIGENPQFTMAHHVLGLVYFEGAQYDLALAEFREVLRVKPLAENAWVNIAHCYHRQGKVAEAGAAIVQALKINPQNQPAIDLRLAIEREEAEKAARKEREGIPPFRPRLDR